MDLIKPFQILNLNSYQALLGILLIKESRNLIGQTFWIIVSVQELNNLQRIVGYLDNFSLEISILQTKNKFHTDLINPFLRQLDQVQPKK